jgi:hypothetical protein
MTLPTSPAIGRPPAPSPARWTPARILVVVLGALGVLTGLALLVAGGALTVAAAGQDDGYLTDPDAPLHSTGHAVTVREVGVNASVPGVVADRDLLGRVRIRAAGDDPGRPLFVGIGSRADVDRYLAGVGHDEMRDVDLDPFDVSYRRHAGGPPATPPGDQGFWTVSDAGTGTREVLWDVTPGEWAVVVMNADGSAGVDATVGVDASVPVLRFVGVGFLVAGGAALATGGVLVALAVGTRRRSPYTAVPVGPAR